MKKKTIVIVSILICFFCGVVYLYSMPKKGIYFSKIDNYIPTTYDYISFDIDFYDVKSFDNDVFNDKNDYKCYLISNLGEIESTCKIANVDNYNRVDQYRLYVTAFIDNENLVEINSIRFENSPLDDSVIYDIGSVRIEKKNISKDNSEFNNILKISTVFLGISNNDVYSFDLKNYSNELLLVNSVIFDIGDNNITYEFTCDKTAIPAGEFSSCNITFNNTEALNDYRITPFVEYSVGNNEFYYKCPVIYYEYFTSTLQNEKDILKFIKNN